MSISQEGAAREQIFKRAFATFTALGIVMEMICDNDIFGCKDKNPELNSLTMQYTKSVPSSQK
jgi:hypothetical protein